MALMIWQRNGCEHEVPEELVDYYKQAGWKLKPANRAKPKGEEPKGEGPKGEE